MFYHRRYPHRHYYGVHGYRGSYYAMSFGATLLFFGIILAVIGLIIGMEEGYSIMNVIFLIGIGLIVLGILASVIASSAMARLRSRNQNYDSDNYYDNQPAPAQPASGTYVNQQQAAPRSGKCPSCGASASGGFCQHCGTRM